jgi:Pyridoxamine 5'-phosphate oxidase
MQRHDNNNKRKILTSIEIVDVPPPTDNETPSKSEDVSVSAGTTNLSKDELHNLFQDRNLAFEATLSKDGSPHVTPVWTELVDDLILINTFETSVQHACIHNGINKIFCVQLSSAD